MSIGISVVIFFLSIIALLAEIFLYFVFGFGAAFSGDTTTLTGVAAFFVLLMALTLATGVLAPICAIIEAVAKKKHLGTKILFIFLACVTAFVLLSWAVPSLSKNSSIFSGKGKQSKSDAVKDKAIRSVIDSSVGDIRYRLDYIQQNLYTQILNDQIRLFVQFRNTSNQTIVGIKYLTKIYDAFGDLALEAELKQNMRLKSGKTNKWDWYHYWEDNMFINDEPFDKLKGCVASNSCKVEVRVNQIAFENGQVVGT